MLQTPHFRAFNLSFYPHEYIYYLEIKQLAESLSFYRHRRSSQRPKAVCNNINLLLVMGHVAV